MSSPYVAHLSVSASFGVNTVVGGTTCSADSLREAAFWRNMARHYLAMGNALLQRQALDRFWSCILDSRIHRQGECYNLPNDDAAWAMHRYSAEEVF